MVSVFVPILYLAVLIGSLGTFSYYYRKRMLKQSAEARTLMEEWFPQHTPRDIYFTLQSMVDTPEPAKTNDKDEAPKVTTGMLKAALLLRAVEDIKRLQSLQNRRNALNALLQRGASAGAGDFPSRFAQLEEEMKAEVVDVATEAEALQPGWNQIIFATASEMVANEKSRQRLGQIIPMAKRERAVWEKAQKEGLKERQTRSVQQGTQRRAKEVAAAKEAAEKKAVMDEAVREKAAKELIEAEEEESKRKQGGASPKTSRSTSPKATKKKK